MSDGMKPNLNNDSSLSTIEAIDRDFSNRFIALDPKGYFLIKIDNSSKELVIDHFSNDIDEEGTALDPLTGQPISCNSQSPREPMQTFRGRTAKELGIKLTEGEAPFLSQLDHALYLGRELQKAEACMLKGISYIQD